MPVDLARGDAQRGRELRGQPRQRNLLRARHGFEGLALHPRDDLDADGVVVVRVPLGEGLLLFHRADLAAHGLALERGDLGRRALVLLHAARLDETHVVGLLVDGSRLVDRAVLVDEEVRSVGVGRLVAVE